MDTKDSLRLKGTQQENTKLTEFLAEAVYVLELARCCLPATKVNSNLRKSALAARLDVLLDRIDNELGEDFVVLVKKHGA